MNPDLNTFLQLWTGGSDVSEDERRRILGLLRDDAAFRAECAAEISLLGLCQAAQSPPTHWHDLAAALGVDDSAEAAGSRDFALGVMEEVARQIHGPRPQTFWFRVRRSPLAAAAAGLVFGVFSASMVWVCAMPLVARTGQRGATVLTEGFEDPGLSPRRGFPRGANSWSGDLSAPVTASSGVTPEEGTHMVQLAPNSLRKLGYAWRIPDLAELPLAVESGLYELDVSASFTAPDAAGPSRYQIRLAAFSQEPSEVRAIWNNEPLLFETVLQHVGRNLRTKPGDRGWQTLTASLDIPPGTRSLLVSLAAGKSEDAQPDSVRFLDNIQVRLITRQPQH